MAKAGGAGEIVRLCDRAAKAGYNGLLLWDSNLWDRELPWSYSANARALQESVDRLHFAFFVEMAPCRDALGEWAAADSVLEPRPPDPHPDEKNRRWLCLSTPVVFDIWEKQLRRAAELYHPTGWLLGYDELMVAARDERCRATGKSAGQLLAEHARRATALVRKLTPGAVAAVWNDMFDPNANARERYYHAAGGFAGSWDGLDPEVLVVNWTPSLESLRFWSGRGNRQVIAGYYDRRLGSDREAAFTAAARQLPGVGGWMYTTWENNYRDLESFGAVCNPGSGAPTQPPSAR